MKNILIIFFTFYSVIMLADDKYPQNDFISPVEHQITLSGNFAELRRNHFHSGIDIRTDGVIGKKIRSIADGYISRIKVSPTGFGKAIYIRHKNGYTSVYGHLNRFSKEVAAWVKSQQYKRKSFAVDLYPEANQFVFKQGDLIAYSGNSGGSEGPHLHFEIRETKNEKPINPLLFGFKVIDDIQPKITGFKIYPLDKNAIINGKNSTQEFRITGKGLFNKLKHKGAIKVSGDIGFSIKTYDLLNDSYSKNGVYSIKLFIDSSLIYAHKLEKFSFSESKYINSLIDYEHYIDHKNRYQKSVVDEGNQLSFIQKGLDKGLVTFNDSLIHTLVYEISDVHGNLSRLTCQLQSEKSVETDTILEAQNEIYFKFNEENSFSNENIKLEFKINSFYKSLDFEYSKREAEEGMYSGVYQVFSKQIPVHRPYSLEIKTKNLPIEFNAKALIVNLDDEKPKAVGGVLKNGFLKTNSRQFGSFAIMLDTVPPEIIALNIHQGKKINGYKKITFEVKDNLSGIKFYKGILNGQWILMEFDPKNDRITYYIDERMKKGKNTILFELIDDRDNHSSFKAEIYY